MATSLDFIGICLIKESRAVTLGIFFIFVGGIQEIKGNLESAVPLHIWPAPTPRDVGASRVTELSSQDGVSQFLKFS